MSVHILAALSLTPQTTFLMLVTVLLNGGAQLLLRAAALRGAEPTRILSLAQSPFFVAGVACYACSVLTWLAVLKRVPLSIATPTIALVYVLVPLAARVVFGDVLNWRIGCGMLLVVAGVTLVARA